MTKLTTAHLQMRPFTLGDDHHLAQLHGDKDLMAFMRSGVQTRDEVMAELVDYRQCWASRGFGVWALFFEGRCIGECGFWLRPGKSFDIRLRILIDKLYWGRGLAGEAINAALDFAFATAGIARVRAVAQEGNPASHRILERAGLILEKTFIGDRGNKLRLYTITAQTWTGLIE